MLFTSIYTFLGGLGLFFLGIKSLSEALQVVAGDVIRKAIRTLTTNRIAGITVGAVVTTIVQSSSITTVMTVGFVNAGLMDLTQALGVIMGANIGTTITGWIIAIKVGKYGLLFIGIGIFPLLFSKRDGVKALGRIFVALGFIFMGLTFMSQAFKPLRDTEIFLSTLQYFTADGYLSLLACVLVGTALTCIIQSSSAMLGVTIALASTGAISFQTAAALVLGENIGTTITAVLASIGTNTNAKRAALGHAIFNVLGVLWVSVIFWKYLDLVDWLVAGNPDFVGANGEKPYISAHIAAGHSIFNVINTLLFIPALNYLARAVTWMVPNPKSKEIPHLKYLATREGNSPSIGIAAAEKELINLSEVVQEQLLLTRDYVRSKKPQKTAYDKIHHLEDVSDSIQTEITVYLCQLQQAKTSSEQSRRIYAIIRAADELESIGDYNAALSRHRNRLEETQTSFNPAVRKDLRTYFDSVIGFYEQIHQCISNDGWELSGIYNRSDLLTAEANRIRSVHLKRLSESLCDPISGMLFSDMIVSLRKVKSHLLNIAEALGADGRTANRQNIDEDDDL